MYQKIVDETAAQQKLDIETQIKAYNWSHRIDIACAIRGEGEVLEWCRANWGSNRKHSFAVRNKRTRSFVRRAIKRLNKKLRDKHYPFMYFHECKWGLENGYGWHIHILLSNRTGYTDYEVTSAIEGEAVELRKWLGLDVVVQEVTKDGPSNYLAKFVEYSKEVERSLGMIQLMRGDEKHLRNVRCSIIEEAREIRDKELACLNEKHKRRFPYLAS